MNPDLARLLQRWRELNRLKDSAWVFPSPAKGGEMPLHGWNIQQWKLSPTGERAGLRRIGWHTLRHTYRAWLGQTDTTMTIQKDLMRRASVATTMNVYGGAFTDAMREANSKLVGQAMAVSGL